MKVQGLLHQNEWSIPMEISTLFPNCCLPLVGGVKDEMVWCGDVEGSFSTTDAV